MNIRKANLEDVDSLSEIANSAFEYSCRWLKPARWANNYFSDLLNANSCRVWVLEQNNQCCGFLVDVTNGNEIHNIKRNNRITFYEIIVKVLYNPCKFINVVLHKIIKSNEQVNYKMLLGNQSSDKKVWIELLAVHSGHRKKGLAEKLIKYCIDYNRKNHANCIGLLVSKNNIPATSLYEKMGFNLVG